MPSPAAVRILPLTAFASPGQSPQAPGASSRRTLEQNGTQHRVVSSTGRRRARGMHGRDSGCNTGAVSPSLSKSGHMNDSPGVSWGSWVSCGCTEGIKGRGVVAARDSRFPYGAVSAWPSEGKEEDDEEGEDDEDEEEEVDEDDEDWGREQTRDAAERGGMSRARQRRLEKTKQSREERKQEQDRIFQEFSRDVVGRHPEMMDLLDDAQNVTPQSAEDLAKKVEERLKEKFGDWIEERTGSDREMEVAIGQPFDPFDLNLWVELHETPTEEDLHSLSSVLRAWYLLGKLGAYNAANLQFTEDIRGSLTGLGPSPDSISSSISNRSNRNSNSSRSLGTGNGAVNGRMDETKTRVDLSRYKSRDDSLAASLHNVSDLEVQGRLARVWVDFGTADMLALDVLINALLCFSSDHVGIRRLTIGGETMPGWNEAAKGVPGSGLRVVEL